MPLLVRLRILRYIQFAISAIQLLLTVVALYAYLTYLSHPQAFVFVPPELDNGSSRFLWAGDGRDHATSSQSLIFR